MLNSIPNLLKFFLALFLLPLSLPAYDYEISIAVISQNEPQYLKEWIEYHQLIGVDHFYFYDNNKNKETKKVLKPYIKSGLVEYIHWPNLWPTQPFDQCCQIKAYKHAHKISKGKTKWLGLIDTDEFIVPNKYKTLTETLAKEYEDKPLIFLNWRVYGTSFVTLPPPYLLLPNLTRCSKRDHPFNRWGKSIFRPESLIAVTNPHIDKGLVNHCDGSGGIYPYASCEGILNHAHPVKDDLLVVNHYIFRDEWFLQNVKIPRLVQRVGSQAAVDEFLKLNEEFCCEECFRILEVMSK